MGRGFTLSKLKQTSCTLSFSYLWSWVNAELKLGLFAIVNRQALHKKGGEARARSAAKGVENEKSLQTRALVGKFANTV